MDLFDLFELDKNPKLTVYVVDNHRPYGQSNVDNFRQVLCHCPCFSLSYYFDPSP